MILDGSGDGLQIHWSLTRQRFDSSFLAHYFFEIFVRVAKALLLLAMLRHPSLWLFVSVSPGPNL